MHSAGVLQGRESHSKAWHHSKNLLDEPGYGDQRSLCYSRRPGACTPTYYHLGLCRHKEDDHEYRAPHEHLKETVEESALRNHTNKRPGTTPVGSYRPSFGIADKGTLQGYIPCSAEGKCKIRLDILTSNSSHILTTHYAGKGQNISCWGCLRRKLGVFTVGTSLETEPAC